jgi:hypothetical protein
VAAKEAVAVVGAANVVIARNAVTVTAMSSLIN